jgi:hypothetical protein
MLLSFCSGNPPHFPNFVQANVNMNMAGQMHPPGGHYVYQNGQYYGAHHMHFAAQQMAQAHMQWNMMQHMARTMQANGHNTHGLPVQQNM